MKRLRLRGIPLTHGSLRQASVSSRALRDGQLGHPPGLAPLNWASNVNCETAGRQLTRALHHRTPFPLPPSPFMRLLSPGQISLTTQDLPVDLLNAPLPRLSLVVIKQLRREDLLDYDTRVLRGVICVGQATLVRGSPDRWVGGEWIIAHACLCLREREAPCRWTRWSVR